MYWLEIWEAGDWRKCSDPTSDRAKVERMQRDMTIAEQSKPENQRTWYRVKGD